MKIKPGRIWTVRIAGILVVFLLLILPISAVIVADIDLVTEKRPYNSDNPRKHVESDFFKIPSKGVLTITYETGSYYELTYGWGEQGGSPFYVGPVREVIRTPNLPNLAIDVGRPFKEVTIVDVNTPQGSNLFQAYLKAPGECISFQNCNEGTQYAAKQKYSIDFTPSDDPGKTIKTQPPGDGCSWKGSWSGAPQYFGGAITLTQSGNSVTGTYPLNDGRITGKISGNIISGTWYEGSKSGPIELTMLSDCKKVSGRVSSSSGGEMSYKFDLTKS
jgi:hypothetical protein